jgi:hypothetical protein
MRLLPADAQQKDRQAASGNETVSLFRACHHSLSIWHCSMTFAGMPAAVLVHTTPHHTTPHHTTPHHTTPHHTTPLSPLSPLPAPAQNHSLDRGSAWFCLLRSSILPICSWAFRLDIRMPNYRLKYAGRRQQPHAVTLTGRLADTACETCHVTLRRRGSAV